MSARTSSTPSAPELPLPGHGSGTGWFVYGVTAGTIAVPDRLRGIDGQPLHLLRDGDLAAVVSTTLVGRSKDRAVERESYTTVLDTLARRQVVVPVAFGAVFADESEVHDRLLGPFAARFAARLAHLAGRVELRLVVTRRDDTPGGAADGSEQGRSVAHELVETLGPLCVALVERPAPDPGTLLDAALLVERSRLAGLQGVVDALGGSGNGAVALTLEGPMAAYDFVDDPLP